MIRTRFVIAAATILAMALPAAAKTYKNNYSEPCSAVWSAVRDTLSNQDNYAVTQTDDAQMTATYDVKHAAHVNISGALLQRANRVKLVANGAGGCEMQVISNYSGWEHNDQGDFKQRVDDALTRLKAAPAAESPQQPAPQQPMMQQQGMPPK